MKSAPTMKAYQSSNIIYTPGPILQLQCWPERREKKIGLKKKQKDAGIQPQANLKERLSLNAKGL